MLLDLFLAIRLFLYVTCHTVFCFAFLPIMSLNPLPRLTCVLYTFPLPFPLHLSGSHAVLGYKFMAKIITPAPPITPLYDPSLLFFFFRVHLLLIFSFSCFTSLTYFPLPTFLSLTFPSQLIILLESYIIHRMFQKKNYTLEKQCNTYFYTKHDANNKT